MRLLVVVGTRPEAIKLAPVIRELHVRAGEGMLEVKVCVTAQHREMLDQVLSVFGIIPDFDLNLMQEAQTPTRLGASVLAALEPVLERENPDWVIVQGDTTTAACAALAAHYTRIKVAHVEAGLRTYSKWNPFPEEVNRRLVGVIADHHFAPTDKARKNLLSEGTPTDDITVTGNPVIDALGFAAQLPMPQSAASIFDTAMARSTEGETPRLIVVTTHRRENIGQPLQNICSGITAIASRQDVRVVHVAHPNPDVWNTVHRYLEGVPHVTIVPPVDYVTMVHLMKRAHVVLTDSGGIQEEAPSLGKPVLVLRDVTERTEAVEAGTVKVIGTEAAHLVSNAVTLLDDPVAYERMARAINPYGDGKASQRIVGTLLGESVDEFVQ